MMQAVPRTKFAAGPLTFTVKHELWDGNIQDHADQGVSSAVTALVAGKETTLLRFNCFDFEKSYIYGPENPDLEVAGPEMLGGAPLTNLYRMDPIADGNPIGWTIKTLGTKLPKMLERAGCPQIAAATGLAEVAHILPDVEACARELYAVKRNTVRIAYRWASPVLGPPYRATSTTSVRHRACGGTVRPLRRNAAGNRLLPERVTTHFPDGRSHDPDPMRTGIDRVRANSIALPVSGR
jgi:hypothetical protein